ncbi:MAG: hypothetical protein R3E01_11605 [Pirellulaceae bacterium]|nr:hypothetical protein [Planctomycetales bacterium]
MNQPTPSTSLSTIADSLRGYEVFTYATCPNQAPDRRIAKEDLFETVPIKHYHSPVSAPAI